MARDIESLTLRMSADLRRFEKSMNSMRATADKRLTEVERRAVQSQRNLSRTMGRAGTDMVSSLRSSLSGLAPVLAGAFSVGAVIRYADSYTSLQNRLKAAGLEGERLVRVENSLFDAANRNGVAVDSVAQLFQRASLSRDALGASDEQLIALTNGVSAALRVQGVTAEQASGPLLQLGQALGAGTVRAEELNSLLEGSPIILQAAANGSERFRGNMEALTAAVRDGKVSSQELFASLLKGLPELEARAAQLPLTVGQALTVLNNQLGRFVGEADAGLSATQRMAQGIVGLANNLDRIVPILGVLATLVGTRYLLALTANSGALIANGIATARLAAFQTAMTASMTGTTTATVIATGAMARFNAMLLANPVGAVIVAVAALSAGIFFLSKRLSEGSPAMQELGAQSANTTKALDAYEEASKTAANASGSARDAALEAAAAFRAEAAEAVVATRALLEKARASRIAAAQAEGAAARQLMGSTSKYGREAASGTYAAAESRASAAREAEFQAGYDFAEASNRLSRIDTNSRSGAYRTPAISRSSGDGGGGGGGGGGSDGAQIAKARAALAIEEEIARARATGDEAAIKAAEERQRLAQLTQQYESAGYADANARAVKHLALLNAAEQLVDDRAKAEEEVERILAGRQRQMEREAEYAQLLNDQLFDRMSFERELATLAGQAGALGDAERRLFIEERTNEILRLRLALTEQEARARASQEFDQLRAADIRGTQGAPDPAVDRAAAYEELARLRENDLLSESEAAQRKLAIDSAYWQSRMTFASDFFGNFAALSVLQNKKLAAIGKAAAIAQATIDGVLAVQKTLSAYPAPLNFIMAASVAAAAAANVASIAGMADGGMVTGSGGPRQDNQLRWLSSGEFVNTAASVRKNRPYLEAANNGADLGKMIPGLADGGIVGRVNAATAIVGRVSAPQSSSLTFAPVIDARGADLSAVRRLEAIMADERRNFADRVNGVRDKRQAYKLGGRK